MKKKMQRKYSLAVSLVLFVFVVFFLTNIFLGAFSILLFRLNIITPELAGRGHGQLVVLPLLIISIVIGTSIAAFFSRKALRPLQTVIAGTKKIAKGDFETRIALEQGPQEMIDLVESFNIMAEELGNIETLRGDFVSNVSHEFKTPVVSIKGFAKLLKKDTLSEESRREYLDIIIRESDRLAGLASNVLLLSNLEKQDTLGDVSEFALDEHIRRTILLLEPSWKKKKLEFRLYLEPAVYSGNEEMLQQVWINLLGNAIKFTPEGGEITIDLRRTEENTYAVAIRDSGIGMDCQTIRHIFDKFYQGDKSHSMQGNGLGLALVKRILELSGGHVDVESTLGQGAVFTVILPCRLL